jgi:hypothetical protein
MRRALLFTVLLCLSAPAGAVAAPGNVIRDCTDNGRMDGRHSQSDYSAALKRLPSDVDEYTECRRIIEAAKRRDAQTPGGGTGGTGTSGGGGFGSPPISGFDGTDPPPAANVPANPTETTALAKPGSAPVAVAGEPITPGGSGITEAAFRHSLPGPLLVVVILFGLGALATTVSGARGRGWRAPSPVLRVFDRVFPHRA